MPPGPDYGMACVALVATKVADLAEELLASVATRLEDAGLTVPSRQYVTVGEVALDCPEQLVVAVTGLVHAFPGEEAAMAICAPPRSVALSVWLTRCVPTVQENGDPPTAAALNASGVELATDAWVLPYVIWEGHRADDDGWGEACDSILLGPVIPYGPSGQTGGVHADLSVLI